ncbi:MAG: cupin domain-containing protein [Alphaproteobacteria bacterium]|nr:cupin domain-containing protein [Alphaproteobacteria bacterium]
MQRGSLTAALPQQLKSELVTSLAQAASMRIERIVSTGHTTPAGTWYDQEWNEWVLLVSGRARLRFADDTAEVALAPGDYVNIPKRRRHRVEWTDPQVPTVWLAVHYA